MAGATDDAELMARYATGDVTAFERVYSRHKGPLYRYFYRQCADRDTADELFQAVWIRTLKASEGGGSRSGFTTDLYRTAHSYLADHFRATGRSLADTAATTPDSVPDESDPAFASARWSLVDWEQGPADAGSGSDTGASSQSAVRTQSALEALSPAQRELFLLHEEAELGVADIAAVTGNTSTAEREAVLSRHSALAADYHKLGRVEPAPALDEKILATARSATKANPKATAPKIPPAQPAAITAPEATAGSAAVLEAGERRKRPRPQPENDDDDPPASRRPRWLIPAAVVATLAVGAGLAVYMTSPDGSGKSPLDGSLFAKRARERGEAGKAAVAASAEQEAEVVVLDSAPLPPPPVFEPEGPQVQDLDAAIALIRKELVLVNQTAAVAEEAAARDRQEALKAGKVADTAAPEAAPASVIQPRERRLTKILELYDDGNPDLAADSLEIFLRDFEDDPISQRILAIKP